MDRLEEVLGVFERISEIKILSPFLIAKEHSITGKILLTVEGKELTFTVRLPETYPLGNSRDMSTIFSTDKFYNYPHVLSKGRICLRPHKTVALSEKLEEEILLLKKWVKKFVIDKGEEEQYEYLWFDSADDKIRTTLFFADVNKVFSRGEFGSFKYSSFGENVYNGVRNEFYLVESFDLLEAYFFPNKFTGFWLYIEEEPIVDIYEIVETWADLERFLSVEQLHFLHGLKKNQLLDPMYILLGYDISKTKTQQEVHWQFIKLFKDKFPLEMQAENEKGGIIKCVDQNIHWSRTKNISYDRYFGRGKLNKSITAAKILLVGVGAIGSSLAVSLARGGARFLTIMDFDFIEPGNICRSEYNLVETDVLKCPALEQKLKGISPSMKVNKISSGFPKCRKEMSLFSELQKSFSEFDLIFDCSTDMEVAYMLDQMNLGVPIFNLSITNKAKELVCVTGNAIVEDKAIIFNNLGNDEALFFEGQGCAFPTFQASYVDINMLTNLALKNINLKLNTERLNSFIIKTNEDLSTFNLSVEDF